MYAPFYWTGAAVFGALFAWTIIAAMVEVARRKSKPWSFDVLAAIVFCAGTAALAWWLVSLATKKV